MKAGRMKWMLHAGMCWLMFMLPMRSHAQESNWLGPLSAADSAAINALVLYPDTVRSWILDAARYPEAIVRTSLLQQKTSNEFANAISMLTKEEQEVIWNLTRYPGLIDVLAAGDKKSAKALNEIAMSYPEEIQQSIKDYGSKFHEKFGEIGRLQNQSSAAFEEILKNYPSSAQSAFKELVYFPEVLSILNDHLQMTVLMGDMYQRNPDRVLHTLDSLSVVVARQNAAELEAWNKTIEQDTVLQNDMKQAAISYTTDNGEKASDYANPQPEEFYQHYVCYPYSYWFGYPYWYPTYYWYPYPYWFDWGFYFDPFGHFVVFGMPSYHFTYWYFYHPYYYYEYPYLCNAYIDHYYGPRGGVSDNAGAVRDWVQENSAVLPKDFVHAPAEVRVKTIRELGKFEMEWQKENTVSSVSQAEFLSRNKESYPELRLDTKKSAAVVAEKLPPVRQPAARMPAPQKTPVNKNTGKVPPMYDFNKVQPAQEYHKSTWDRTQPSTAPKRDMVAPIPPSRQKPAQPAKPRQPVKNKP